MSTIPPDFILPPHAVNVATELKRHLSVVARLAIEDIEDAGIASDQATTVIVDMLIELACAMAMDVAIAQGRTPQRARWQEVTGQKFDLTLEKFRLVLDARVIP